MGRSSSWVWKSLIHGRSLLKAEGRRGIGSGQNMNITEENWLASGLKASLLPTTTITIVNYLINPNHEWDMAKL